MWCVCVRAHRAVVRVDLCVRVHIAVVRVAERVICVCARTQQWCVWLSV